MCKMTTLFGPIRIVPIEVHWQATKRVLRYLKGILNHGILLQKTYVLIMVRFIDFDWVSCTDDKKKHRRVWYIL